jgi:hypothetical protein
MSEFTECYQLLAGDVAEGAALLERAGLPGWALPAESGWVTVVVERPYTTEPDPPLIEANRGVLALFVNAEDHGWSLSFWEGPALRSHYRCDWDDEITADTSGLDLDALRRLLSPTVAEQSLDRLAEALEVLPDDDDLARSALGEGPPQQAARLLGFPNTGWISGAYLAGGDDRVAQAVRVTP